MEYTLIASIEREGYEIRTVIDVRDGENEEAIARERFTELGITIADDDTLSLEVI